MFFFFDGAVDGYDWWDLVPAAVGGIIGALAGGIVAYILAKVAAKEAKEKDDAADHRLRKAKVFRVFSVFAEMFNSFGSTYRHIFGMLDGRSSEMNDNAPNQRIIRVLANLEADQFVSINSDDIAVFFEAQRDDFVTDYLEAINGYNSVLNSLKTYSRLKEDMLPILLETEIVEIEKDGAVTSKVGKELRGKLTLLEARAESVITPTLDHMRDLFCSLVEIAERFPIEAKEVLGRDERVPGFDPQSIKDVRAEFSVPPYSSELSIKP